ncbi:MAG: stalk domain-containing protein [Clostridia bacterium]|nr:stalk domain-containing protein [Clostridia bacterium]
MKKRIIAAVTTLLMLSGYAVPAMAEENIAQEGENVSETFDSPDGIARPDNWKFDENAIWQGCVVNYKNNKLWFTHVGKDLSLTMHRNLNKAWVNKTVLVSYEIKINKKASSSYAFPRICSEDSGNIDTATTMVTFSGEKFMFTEEAEGKKVTTDIPIAIRDGITFKFGFEIDLEKRRQNLYVTTDKDEYYELCDRNFYDPNVNSIQAIHFVTKQPKGAEEVADYEMDNLIIEEKTDESFAAFQKKFFKDLQVKVDDLKDIKYIMGQNDMFLYAETPYAITKRRRVLIDSEDDNVTPTITDGRTLVPIRFISERLGAAVTYDNGKVQIKYKDTEINLEIGKEEYSINDEKHMFDVPAQIINGRTMIPLRSVGEALGMEVLWWENGLIAISSDSETLKKKADKILNRIIQSFGVFVSQKSNVNASGTKNDPFSSIVDAQNYIKSLKHGNGIPEGGISVYVMRGEYYIDDTIRFNTTDSGSPEAPITYRAYKDDDVTINGGIKLTWQDFERVTEPEILEVIYPEVRNKLYCVNLKKKGVKSLREITYMRMGGEDTENIGSQEFYVNGRRQTLSRWPNATMAYTGTVTVPGSGVGATFKVSENVPISRWTKAKNPWMYGELKWSWACESVPIKIDEQQKTITVQKRIYDSLESSKPYYVYNLIEEIDVPGEWYIDFDTYMLYWYPREDIDLKNAKMTVAAGMKDEMININGTQFLTLRGFNLEGTRGKGVKINNAFRVNVTDCNIKNISEEAMLIDASAYINVYDCNFNERLEIGADCGDTETLRKGAVVIDNCYFADWSDWLEPAMNIAGIGNVVKNCEITNAKHQGLTIGAGNDLLIENCEFYETNQTSSDAGCIYAGRSWRTTGITLKNNAFHNIGKDAHCVYWDDGLTGNSEIGNIFFNNPGAQQIKGTGSDSTLINNVFINTGTPVMNLAQYDKNAVTDAVAMFSDALYNSLNGIPYENTFWKSKYPGISLRGKERRFPHRAKFVGNIGINTLSNGVFNMDRNALKNNLYPEETQNVFKSNYDIKNVEGFSDSNWKNWDWEWLEKMEFVDFTMPETDNMGVLMSENRQDYPELSDFSLLYPTNGQRNVQAKDMEFVWEKSIGSGISHFVLAKDPDFEEIVYEKDVNWYKGVIPDIEYEYGKTTYYWKVEAIGNAMNHSDNKMCKRIYSFTTAETEELDLTQYKQAVADANELLQKHTEGSGKDNVSRENIEKLNTELIKNDEIINGDHLVTGIMVDECTKNINDAIKAFKKKVIPGHTDLLDVMKYDSSSWTASNPNFIIRKDNTLTFNPTSSSDYGDVFGFKEIMPNNNLWTFKANFNYDSTAQGWQAISLRASGPNSLAWSGGYSYIFIFKPDVIECQKFNSGLDSFYYTVPNEFITVGKDCLVEVGALDDEEGVRLILKVDSKTVFDFVDKEKIIDKEGFVSFVAAQGRPLIIKPAGDDMPSDDELFK